jgi:putative endopeptidase
MTLDTPPLDPANFDRYIEPGTDFYRFANGGWIDANPVPPAYSRWAAFNEVHERNETTLHAVLEEARDSATVPGSPERMVGDFYAAGMDTDAIEGHGLERVRPWLDRITRATSLSDLHELISELATWGISGFFSMGVQADYANPDEYLLYLSQGGLGLPERDYYFNTDDRSVELRSGYVDYLAAMLSHIDADADTDHGVAAVAIMEFETALAEASFTATELRDYDKVLKTFTLEEIGTVTPGFDVAALVRRHTGSHSEVVSVDNLGFLEAMSAIVQSTPIETVKAYLQLRVVGSLASYLPTRFDDTSFDFYGKLLGGQQEQRDRWKRVLAAATGAIRDQVARLFVEAAFSPEAKERCELMVGRLLTAMEKSIRQLVWMEDATKAEALIKLSGFAAKIGYPDEWRDYSTLTVTRDSYVGNMLEGRRFEVARKLAKLGTEVEAEWSIAAHQVNAYYHPLHNEIAFPSGILQPPFFNPDMSDAVNYGSIGAVIGHEITHGFDDQGSKFDATGELRNWWADEDRVRFEERADKLVEQFDAYEVLDGLTVNGRLTLGENIADLGGLALAYAALQVALAEDEAADDTQDESEFTPEQQFFLAFATVWRNTVTDEHLRLRVTTDPHSPADLRCNGTVANFPPFAEAFGLDGDAALVNTGDALVKIW